MNHSRASKCLGMVVAAAFLFAQRSHAVDLDLAAVSCSKYENEVLASTIPGYTADPIDTVMWLFGFAVATSGERAMYGDSLSAFGFALDGECKNNPTSTLLEAATTVKSKRDNPMDLTRLDCATFETRHLSLAKTDTQSANTLTMWLFGYAVGLAGSHILAAESLSKFDDGLQDRCTKHPEDSLYDALSAPNPAVQASAPKPARKSTPKATAPKQAAPAPLPAPAPP